MLSAYKGKRKEKRGKRKAAWQDGPVHRFSHRKTAEPFCGLLRV
jgi:hypothetical protein